MLSIVLPAKNEAENLKRVLPQLVGLYPDAEIIVVNDGSTDETAAVAANCGVSVINHPYCKGNGASIKTGAQAASGDVIVFMDGDGQHNPADIRRLLDHYESGYHLVIGARGAASQASVGRLFANKLYNLMASWMVGRKVDDLTSGFRVVNAKKFKEFLYLLPNGFSYPTTSTMAFFRSGYSVGFVPIHAGKRSGKSHINIFGDGARFFIIIFRVGTLFAPLKLFMPISALFFFLGIGHYIHTFLSEGRFTNMSALLLMTSVLVFLIGLVSEQITSLMYARKQG